MVSKEEMERRKQLIDLIRKNGYELINSIANEEYIYQCDICLRHCKALDIIKDIKTHKKWQIGSRCLEKIRTSKNLAFEYIRINRKSGHYRWNDDLLLDVVFNKYPLTFQEKKEVNEILKEYRKIDKSEVRK